MARILIVEDTFSNAQLLYTVLTASGYQATCAYNGETGLELARQECPDLIIADLRLSGSALSGWDLIQRLREDDVCGGIPVIVAAVQADPQDRERAVAAGCDGYLTKSFQVRELRQMVHDLIGPPATKASDR